MGSICFWLEHQKIFWWMVRMIRLLEPPHQPTQSFSAGPPNINHQSTGPCVFRWIHLFHVTQWRHHAAHHPQGNARLSEHQQYDFLSVVVVQVLDFFFLFGREQLGRRHRQDKKVDRSFSFWRRLTRSTNNKNNNKRTNIWGVFSGLLWQNCWLGEWKRGNTNKILDISNWCEIQSRTAILFKLNVYTTVGQQERIALINSALQTVGAFPLSSRSND